MAIEVQSRTRELFEFLDRIGHNYNGMINSLMYDEEYKSGSSQDDDTTSIGEASTISNDEEALSIRTCEDGIDPPREKRFYQESLGSVLDAPKYHYISIHSSSNGEWYGAIATLDTGSDENWISQEVVDRLRLDVHKGLVTRWKTFNGEAFASDASVRVTWCSRGRGLSYANVFRIVPNAPFDVLFGRNLIMSGEINWSDVNAERGTILTTIGDALPKETPEEKEERLKREAAADAKAKQQIAQNGSRHGNVPDPKRPRNKGQDEKKKSH